MKGLFVLFVLALLVSLNQNASAQNQYGIQLKPGDEVEGPCLLEELTAVTIVPAGARARVEELGVVLEPSA